MLEDVHPAEVEVTSVRLLEMIESAYPNPLSITEMAKYELNCIISTYSFPFDVTTF